jgi:hypothetical protein
MMGDLQKWQGDELKSDEKHRSMTTKESHLGTEMKRTELKRNELKRNEMKRKEMKWSDLRELKKKFYDDDKF